MIAESVINVYNITWSGTSPYILLINRYPYVEQYDIRDYGDSFDTDNTINILNIIYEMYY